MKSYFFYGVIITLIVSSCSINNRLSQNKITSNQKKDTLNEDPKKLEDPIYIGDCGEINLIDYKNLTIWDVKYSEKRFGLINCLVNYTEQGDTIAQKVLFEISNAVGNNVYKFDFNNSSDISKFLKETLFLTPKSNKWIAVLMKYAKDDNCKYFKHGHYPSNEHFGLWVTGAIISNLSNKEYAKELSNFQNRLLNQAREKNENELTTCEMYRTVHKLFMARLEKDLKEGKLNFE